jgi:predicted permease
MLPDWLQITIDILGGLVRTIGLVLLGLGTGWLTLEFFRKGQQAWQVQIAIFLGFIGLVIASTRFLSPFGLGGFGIGAGVAIFLWGMPKPKAKEEQPEEEKVRTKK